MGNTAQRPQAGSVATGQIRFNSQTAEYEGYNGSAWTSLGGASFQTISTAAGTADDIVAGSATDTLNFASGTGITITAARILKFNRFDAGKISFLLSIPTLGAVSIYGVSEILTNQDLNFSILNLFAVFFSFLFSIITIKYFLKYIQKFSFNIFVFYRLILGVILLIIAYL